MKLKQFKKRTKKIPDAPGVYFFLDKRKKMLYIGKATSLRNRTRSYFVPDIAEVRSRYIANMVEKSASLEWRQTDSVLEALILEANIIKRHKPIYNTDLKDDKSWNYVVITKEDFPRVLLVRGQQLHKSKVSGTQKFSTKNFLSPAPSRLRTFPQPSFVSRHVFGPFPHGLQLKEAMKLIRKIFPFRDTCVPCQSDASTSGLPRHRLCKPCFNAQVALCPGVCSGKVSKQEYKKTIRHITFLFQGKKKQLTLLLGREMKEAAKEEKFEDAALLRRQMFALQHIQDVSLIKEEYRNPSPSTPLDGTQGKPLGAIRSARIEAYDVAHLRGRAAVGVMTVVEGGVAQKSEYKKFRIRAAKAGDDTGALREVLSRRLGHNEWQLPRLVVVDGGTAQVNTVKKTLESVGVKIPVVGVVKDEKHRPRNILGQQEYIKNREREILLANAEAHRFAVAYHRKKLRGFL